VDHRAAVAALVDHVAKCPCVRSNSIVARDERNELRRFCEQLHGGQVDRVEYANWFDRKGSTNAVQHGSVDVEKEAAPFEGAKGADTLATSGRQRGPVPRQEGIYARVVPPQADKINFAGFRSVLVNLVAAIARDKTSIITATR
jgi:hypothetical protein